MHIPHDEVKVGDLARVEQGSYYCENSRGFVLIDSEQIGIIVHVFKYDEITYPWKTLGYKYLVDIIIGPHKLRDIPNFKIHGV
tara:strand:- start:1207 stop:1455 length:249 start_codon:yes stop_codon:yes gene_type:complete